LEFIRLYLALPKVGLKWSFLLGSLPALVSPLLCFLFVLRLIIVYHRFDPLISNYVFLPIPILRAMCFHWFVFLLIGMIQSVWLDPLDEQFLLMRQLILKVHSRRPVPVFSGLPLGLSLPSVLLGEPLDLRERLDELIGGLGDLYKQKVTS